MPNYTSPTGYSPYNDQLTSSVSHPVGTWSYPMTTKIDYQETSAAVYIGYSLPGSPTSSPMWAIQFVQYDGNGNTISTTWSSNYSSFGDIWDNRATLSYA